MQVTVCKEMNSAKEYHLPAPKEKLSLEAPAVLLTFNPGEITSPNKKPEIRITDFYVHDKAVRLGMKSGRYDIVTTSVTNSDKFHLSHKDNSFSIELSAMEFYSPERISYSYTFNSNTWVNLQSGVNRISFSELTPGIYHFQVKARDYNSYSEIKKLTIIISPPWYVSWWAKTIYCLTAVIITIFHHSANTPTVSCTSGNVGTYTCRTAE